MTTDDPIASSAEAVIGCEIDAVGVGPGGAHLTLYLRRPDGLPEMLLIGTNDGALTLVAGSDLTLDDQLQIPDDEIVFITKKKT